MTLFPRLRKAHAALTAAEANLAVERTLRATTTARAINLGAELATVRRDCARLTTALEELLGVTGWCSACLAKLHRLCFNGTCRCSLGDHPGRTDGERRVGEVDDTIAFTDLYPHLWWFTFYREQTHPVSGAPLGDSYVVIFGLRDEARAQMCKRFGDHWAAQYATGEEAGVFDWHLTELTGSDALGVLAPASVPDFPSERAEERSWLADDRAAVRRADR